MKTFKMDEEVEPFGRDFMLRDGLDDDDSSPGTPTQLEPNESGTITTVTPAPKTVPNADEDLTRTSQYIEKCKKNTILC